MISVCNFHLQKKSCAEPMRCMGMGFTKARCCA